jgi:hypothetical protein
MDDDHQREIPKNEDDYVWRFSLQSPPSTCRYDDPLVEMVRAFFADFLNMGFFTRHGKRVKVDGFTFTIDPKTIYKIFPEEAPGGEG